MKLTEDERRARKNPICCEFRRMSLALGRKLCRRLKPGWTYKRDPNNTYGITLQRKRTRYQIWWFNNGSEENFVTIDRWSRASRGITTDPDLKVCGCFEFGPDAIEQTLARLTEALK